MSDKCPDCQVEAGRLHHDGCDVERCPDCGGQLLSCGCGDPPKYPWLIWTGEWPGVAEARARGWYSYLPSNGGGWTRCAKDHPGASEDLNRLMEETRWNPVTRTREDIKKVPVRPAMTEYRELERRLRALRRKAPWLYPTNESPLLERMTEVWEELTTEEQDLIYSEGAKIPLPPQASSEDIQKVVDKWLSAAGVPSELYRGPLTETLTTREADLLALLRGLVQTKETPSQGDQ